MKKKSLGINALLNGIKSIMAVIFPLISFPYVSKVLQVENIGKYNFVNSIVSYYVLLASLGITTYAIREGAKYRDDVENIKKFANQIFSINIFSTIVSYIMLIISIVTIPKFQNYMLLIIIFSIQMIFNAIGVEWIYSIYEDYLYITVRSIVIQIVSLLAMFLLVRKKSDYYTYALITVIANAGANVFNYIHAKSFCKISFTYKIDWKRHLKPIMIIFATSIATTIYVNSDMTLLGFLKTDYEVGLYSISVKIYKVVKSLLSAVLVVSVPRLSNYLGTNQKEKYNKTFNKILKTMFILVTPAVVGLYVLSDKIVLIISDKSYLPATNSLKILTVALYFCMFGWLFNSCVLIPNKKETKVFEATLISALLNLIANFILIPFWGQDAAAFTTLLAEACSMIICVICSKGLIKIEAMLKTIINVLLGCGGIIFICLGIDCLIANIYIKLFSCVFCSVLGYGIILLIGGEEMIRDIIKKCIQN